MTAAMSVEVPAVAEVSVVSAAPVEAAVVAAPVERAPVVATAIEPSVEVSPAAVAPAVVEPKVIELTAKAAEVDEVPEAATNDVVKLPTHRDAQDSAGGVDGGGAFAISAPFVGGFERVGLGVT